jgi:hypothetical protein
MDQLLSEKERNLCHHFFSVPHRARIIVPPKKPTFEISSGQNVPTTGLCSLGSKDSKYIKIFVVRCFRAKLLPKIDWQFCQKMALKTPPIETSDQRGGRDFGGPD